jgi:hypothetical protein
MNDDYFNKLLVFIVFSVLNIIKADYAFSERYVTIATIGNTPSSIESENKQEIVDHVINFWDKELKQVLYDKPDLIVLPELCDLSLTGEDYLKVRKSQVLDFFTSVAKSNKCYIAFGMQREDKDGFWRNSCVVIGRNGEIAGIYDKNFPTIGEMEIGIKASNEAPIIECDFGRVAIAICFDLNFDELRMRYVKEKPDLIIFSSMYHGGMVQSLWAYSCQSYFVSAVYRGYSSEIRDPLGDVISSSSHNSDYALEKINLDFKRVHLAYNYLNLTALKGKYGKTVKISDPGEYASVLVSSENKNVSVDKMIEEFEIELFDDYLDRAREFRLEEGNLE